MYSYRNVNPNHANVEDCAIRAISVAEGISWDKAYDKLSDSARDMGLMMNSVEAVEEYLDEKYMRVPIYVDTVGEFINTHPKGIYLITMPNHITVLKQGFNYDTFNPAKRPIRSAWKVLFDKNKII